MAVYTHLQHEEIEAIRAAYGNWKSLSVSPISEGIENSNYLLEITGQNDENEKAIFTIFEQRTRNEDVPFFLALMEHLQGCGVMIPRPIPLQNGAMMHRIRDQKMGVVFSYLHGRSLLGERLQHAPVMCFEQLGATVAKLHDGVAGFKETRQNDLALAGWQRLYEAIAPEADRIVEGLGQFIEQELHFLQRHWPQDLPTGVVHADLFPDNVFFEGDKISGVFDWYFACNDAYLYDVMITMNAWCFLENGQLNHSKARALLRAYHQRRPISAAERTQLPILARGAALRFLLTRSYDWLNQKEGAIVKVKDPLEYLHKLRYLQAWHADSEYVE